MQQIYLITLAEIYTSHYFGINLLHAMQVYFNILLSMFLKQSQLEAYCQTFLETTLNWTDRTEDMHIRIEPEPYSYFFIAAKNPNWTLTFGRIRTEPNQWGSELWRFFAIA